MIRLKIKEVAEAKHISQRKLLMLTGVDIKNIQKIYRDPYRVVNTETRDKIARVLNVDVRELPESVPEDTTENQDRLNRLWLHNRSQRRSPPKARDSSS